MSDIRSWTDKYCSSFLLRIYDTDMNQYMAKKTVNRSVPVLVVVLYMSHSSSCSVLNSDMDTYGQERRDFARALTHNTFIGNLLDLRSK